MPRHCQKFKCRIAMDLFLNGSRTSLTSGNGDAARAFARKERRKYVVMQLPAAFCHLVS